MNRIGIMQLGVLIERLEDYQRLLKQIEHSLECVINEHYRLTEYEWLLNTRMMIRHNLRSREELDIAIRAMERDIAFWTKQHQEERRIYNQDRKWSDQL